jgi:hypothetical protein
VAVATEPEQQLAWEARQRPRAAVAAIVAGFLTVAGYLWAGLGLRDAPGASYLEALGNAVAPGPVGEQPSVKTPLFEYYHEHAATIIGSATVRAVALFAFGWAVTFLAAATRARRPEFLRLAVYLPIVGGALAAVSTVAGAIGTTTAISNFLDGPRTVDAAREVSGGSLLVTAEILGQIGPLALVAGVFLVALNAMRVGLLTRFLGFLGIIAAVLTILPLMPLPIVQSFWLVGVGLLLLGLVPGGMPPAWRTGRAEPWPSSQQAAAARREAAASKKRPAKEPAPQPEPVAAGHAHPNSKKRKRKRRG